MAITVKYFGAIADFAGKSEELFSVSMESMDVHAIQHKVQKLYPEICSTPYSIAVNQSIERGNCAVNDGDELAFLPPFAGG